MQPSCYRFGAFFVCAAASACSSSGLTLAPEADGGSGAASGSAATSGSSGGGVASGASSGDSAGVSSGSSGVGSTGGSGSTSGSATSGSAGSGTFSSGSAMSGVADSGSVASGGASSGTSGGSGTCPAGASVTFEISLAPGVSATYCYGAASCTPTFVTVRPPGGDALDIDEPFCATDCDTCRVPFCPAIECLAPSPLTTTPVTHVWDGTVWQSSTCNESDPSIANVACERGACAPAGQYVATMCASLTTGQAFCVGAQQPATCKDFPFDWPPPGGSETLKWVVGDADAGTTVACKSTADCTPGLECGFPQTPACTSTGQCFVAPAVSCLAYSPGCACDGTEINIACTGLPSGYATKPLRHTGACVDGG